MAAARSPPLTQQTLALVLLVFAATTAAASLPPYCGVQPGTPVPRIPALTPPPSPAVAQLQQVMVLIRHGDRTNIGTPPCWPNDSAVWWCDLADYTVPSTDFYATSTKVPRLYRKRTPWRTRHRRHCRPSSMIDGDCHTQVTWRLARTTRATACRAS